MRGDSSQTIPGSGSCSGTCHEGVDPGNLPAQYWAKWPLLHWMAVARSVWRRSISGSPQVHGEPTGSIHANQRHYSNQEPSDPMKAALLITGVILVVLGVLAFAGVGFTTNRARVAV